MMERIRARGGDPAGAGRGSRGRGEAPGAPPADRTAARPQGEATTIDALFGPLRIVETRGQVWQYTDKQLTPLRLRLGISDGQFTEVSDGGLEAGSEVVTNISTGAEVRTQPTGGGFPPFMGGRGRDGGGGNRGGGGNNRGGGGR